MSKPAVGGGTPDHLETEPRLTPQQTFEMLSLEDAAERYPEVEEETMSKGYWIAFYRSISDPAALAAYAKLAGPAVTANSGRFLARGSTVKTYEQGIAERTIAIEFDTVEQAIAAHDSPAYQEALAALGNTCERDMRIVEGVD
jgi:uncharacterized protein (DUF1330 family)